MTWVKLDDDFPDHPKVIAAGPGAAWLFVSGLCYAGRYLTDGFIPKAALGKLTELPRPANLARRLVEHGLWDESEGGWRIHDFAEHQRTKDRVIADRESAATRQARRRAKETSPRESERESRRDAPVTHGPVTPLEVEVDESREEITNDVSPTGREPARQPPTDDDDRITRVIHETARIIGEQRAQQPGVDNPIGFAIAAAEAILTNPRDAKRLAEIRELAEAGLTAANIAAEVEPPKPPSIADEFKAGGKSRTWGPSDEAIAADSAAARERALKREQETANAIADGMTVRLPVEMVKDFAADARAALNKRTGETA